MERTTIQVGTFEVNCSILAEDGKAWIVDPGAEAERIIALLEKKRLTPAGILLTHAHFDHIGGIPALQAAFPDLPVFVHSADIPAFTHPANQFPPDYPAIGQPGKVKVIGQGQQRNSSSIASPLPSPLDLLNLTFIPTPGHTPGGVCYLLTPNLKPQTSNLKPQPPTLLSGDTLFAGSVGRTDFPGGDMATLMRSLEKLKTLPPETVVVPGHGPLTTIADELAGNPFLQ